MQAGFTMGNLTSALGLQALAHEDAALVSALKEGSEEAFALLIAQYSKPLYSLVARSLKNPDDAADIIQEVFIKVFRNIRGFHGESSLRTWLYRIALHESSNQKRWWCRHKRQEVTIDTPLTAAENAEGDDSLSLGATLADGRGSPYDHTVQLQLKARIETCLRAVPEAFRTVIVLREIEGFSYDEIAEVVGVPVGTVKSRLKRGRLALKQQMRADGLDHILTSSTSTGGTR